MFRERLHVKTGCERCKIRRKKCDEQRPSCTYCTKWNLTCAYTDASLDTSDSRVDDPEQRGVQVHKNNAGHDLIHESVRRPFVCQPWSSSNLGLRRIATEALDPFHLLPIAQIPRAREANHRLWLFFAGMISDITPHNILLPRQAFTQGMFEAMFSSLAVCCAIFSSAATYEAYETQNLSSRLASLEFQSRTERLIQVELDRGNFLEENVLVATTLHLVTSVAKKYSQIQLIQLANGIKALINVRGGFNQALRNSKISTIMGIIAADTIACRSTGQGPFLIEYYPKPTCPNTFMEYTVAVDPKIIRDWDVDAAHVLEAVKFMLLFRKPAYVVREGLSDDESWYIFKLHYWIDITLNCLQRIHRGSGSLSEIVTLTLLIFKMEVLEEVTSHEHIFPTVLKRLGSALRTYITAAQASPLNVAIVWSCIVASGGPSLTSERSFFRELLRSFDLTAEEILNIAVGFAWHESISLDLHCHERALHTHI